MSNYFMKVNKELFKSGLSPLEILIVSQIEEFNINTGDCFISDATLAENFGVSESTVKRAIKALEEKGYITRETRNVKGGKVRHMRIAKTYKCQNEPCTSVKMNFDKVQNDTIKDNIKHNSLKDNYGLLPSGNKPGATLPAAKAPTNKPAGEITVAQLAAMGARYEISWDDCARIAKARIIDTGAEFIIKQ